MSDQELTYTEKIVKITIGSVSLALNILTILFAIYNFWKYLYGKRVAKVLIVLFYLFVFVCTLCQCYISAKYIMLEKPSDYWTVPLKISVIGLYYVVGFSMYTLALSIRRSLRIIRKRVMIRRQRISIVLFVLLMLPNLSLLFLNNEIVEIVSGVLVLSINAVGFLYLRCQLQKLGQESMSKTITSINTQNIVFILVFVIHNVRVLLQTIGVIDPSKFAAM